MKIELENGSTIETLNSEDKPIRGRRANINPWLYNFESPGISDEKLVEVLEPFMIKDSPDFKREYDCIWCSSSLLIKENYQGGSMNKGWIEVSNGIGYPMPEEDCEIWIARGSCFGDGWIQKVDYYNEIGYIEWDGTFAYQKVIDGVTPEPFIMKFTGNKELVCGVLK